MPNRFRFVLHVILLVFIVNVTFAQDENQERQHRYRPQQFENDSRAEWQKVDTVIEKMGLKRGQSIADIGGGSGYFSRPFAKTVGEKGVVYCCDLATNLMDYLQEEAKKENLNNLVTVYAAMDRPMLPPNSVDFIFFCDTNHHLQNRVAYYRGLKPLLRSGGKLVVVDWRKREQKVGPPPGHNVAKSVVLDEMKEAGWKLVSDLDDVLPYQYFLIFE